MTEPEKNDPGTTSKPTAHISVWASKEQPPRTQDLKMEEPKARYEEIHAAITFAESLKKENDLAYILVAQLMDDGTYQNIRHWARTPDGWDDLPVAPYRPNHSA
jgi:hypothetical protein